MTVSANERVVADEQARDWRKRKLKFVSSVRTSNVDKHIVEGEAAVRLCNYTDVYYHEEITPDMPFMQGSATEGEIERFGLKKGQVLLTKDSESWEDIAVPAYVSETMPEVVCGYHLAVIETDSDEVDGRYLSWLAQSPVLNDQFKLSAKGVTRFGLSQHALKNAVIDAPPLEYQLKVAAFLDRKTAEIDTLIAKKRRLLDRLAEKRTALITRAVTKGLNPDAPMKDSGIEWLGEIPAHWRVGHLRRALLKVEQGWSPACEDRPVIEGEWGVLKSGCVNGGEYDESNHKALPAGLEPRPSLLVQPSDVLMCRASGSTHLIGSVAIVRETTRQLMFSDKTYRLSVDEGVISSSFLVHSMDSKYMREQILLSISGAEGLANNIPQSAMKDYQICIPPLDEQKAIDRRIEEEKARGVEIADRIERAIERLKEYRSALITNAVTGQIKVA